MFRDGGLELISFHSAGYALFKAKDKKLLKRESLVDDLSTADGVCSALKLKKFMVCLFPCCLGRAYVLIWHVEI